MSSSPGSGSGRAGTTAAGFGAGRAGMARVLEAGRAAGRPPHAAGGRRPRPGAAGPQAVHRHGADQEEGPAGHAHRTADPPGHRRRRRHHLSGLHRDNRHPGRQSGRVRLRPARQALRMGCHRPRHLRLLRARPGRLGLGRGLHPPRHLLTSRRAPSDTTVQPPARRPGLLRRRRARGHVRRQQHAHRRPATRPERRAGQPVLILVRLNRQQRRPTLTEARGWRG